MTNKVDQVYTEKLRSFMGTSKAVGKAIGCSGATISSALKTGKIAKQYELSCELLYKKMHSDQIDPDVASEQTDRKALTAENLKSELWGTLQDIKEEKVDAKTANAIAAQARSIISTVSVEIAIQNCANNLSAGVKEFANA